MSRPDYNEKAGMMFKIAWKAEREILNSTGISVKLTISARGRQIGNNSLEKAKNLLILICDQLLINEEDLTQHKRTKCIIDARRISINVISTYFPLLSLEKIGEIMGGFDHSTIVYHKQKFTDLYETDKSFRKTYDNVLQHLIANHASLLSHDINFDGDGLLPEGESGNSKMPELP